MQLVRFAGRDDFVSYTLTLVFLEAKRKNGMFFPPLPAPLSSVLRVCVAVLRRPGQSPSWHSHGPRACTHTSLGPFPLKSLCLTVPCQIYRSQSVRTKSQVRKHIGWTPQRQMNQYPLRGHGPRQGENGELSLCYLWKMVMSS